jgi:hypothetical protein
MSNESLTWRGECWWYLKRQYIVLNEPNRLQIPTDEAENMDYLQAVLSPICVPENEEIASSHCEGFHY